jgi:hypothetical protein
MTKETISPHIKANIYWDAVALFEDGALYPSITETLLKKYTAGREKTAELIESARYREWDAFLEKAEELSAQKLSFPEIKNQLLLLNDDEELVDYIANKWYEVKTEDQKRRIPIIFSLRDLTLSLIVWGILVFLVFYDNASGIFKIICSLGFFIAFILFLFTLNEKFAEKKNHTTTSYKTDV